MQSWGFITPIDVNTLYAHGDIATPGEVKTKFVFFGGVDKLVTYWRGQRHLYETLLKAQSMIAEKSSTHSTWHPN